jgi:hypothetical protein
MFGPFDLPEVFKKLSLDASVKIIQERPGCPGE